MNSVLETMLQTGCAESANGESIKIHSNILPEEGEFLQNLISEIDAATTLEIGLAFGISALFICEAISKVPGGRHIIVDPAQSSDAWKGCGIQALKSAGYGEIIEFHELPSHKILPELHTQGRQVDFAFIDGAHSFDYALVDFFLVDKLLKVGGVIAFDDLWMPGIQRLCRYILTNHSYDVFRCFPSPADRRTKPSLKRRLLQRAVKSSAALQRVVKLEYAEPEIDLTLGLPNQCIAFKKLSDDQRPWDFYHDF